MKSTEEFDAKNDGAEDNDEIEVLNQTEDLNQTEETEPNIKTDNADFDVLKQHFPEIKSADDVPKEAERISKKENIPIFDAYLRYLFFENKRIKEEQENREKNIMNTVGSLKSADSDYGMSYINAMLKAIRK